MTADPNRLEVYCLDVGQGDCTIIVPPRGEGDPILFDCADDHVARRFLENHAIRRLEAVVASHADFDHVRGLLPLLRGYFQGGGQVGRLFVAVDRPTPGDAAMELIDAAIDWSESPPCAGFTVQPPIRSETAVEIASGADWRVKLVLPFYRNVLTAQTRGGAANSASAVLRIERGAAALLIGGDAPLEAWMQLRAGEIQANTIRVPHHGGEIREGTGQSFADLYGAVKADRAVISVGTNNGYYHPFPEHVHAARRGQQCRILCTQMTKQCHRRPLVVRDEALDDVAGSVEPAYRHEAVRGAQRRTNQEVPCAGTVLISIDGGGRTYVLPRPAVHDALVDLLDNPLCRR